MTGRVKSLSETYFKDLVFTKIRIYSFGEKFGKVKTTFVLFFAAKI